MRTIRRAVYLFVDILEILFLARFFITAVGSDYSDSGFVRLVNWLTDPLITPFRDILPPIPAGGVLFDWSLILAMITYILAAYVFLRVLKILALHADKN